MPSAQRGKPMGAAIAVTLLLAILDAADENECNCDYPQIMTPETDHALWCASRRGVGQDPEPLTPWRQPGQHDLDRQPHNESSSLTCPVCVGQDPEETR